MEKPRLVVFDVDGTLIPGTSCERLFFRFLIEHRILNFRNLLNFAIRGLELAPKGKSYIIKANKGYLKGFTPQEIHYVGRSFFEIKVSGRISIAGLLQLQKHRKKKDKVILLSGMPEFLLENVAGFFNVDEYYGSVLGKIDNKYTGKTLGVFPLAQGKVDIVENIIKKHNLKWENVTAYADHYLDRFLLQKVGEPVAVNPDHKLKTIAQRERWRIEYFNKKLMGSGIPDPTM